MNHAYSPAGSQAEGEGDTKEKKEERLIVRIIIWLFEKYAMNDWIERVHREERKRVKDKYDLQTEEEIDQAIIDQSQEAVRRPKTESTAP